MFDELALADKHNANSKSPRIAFMSGGYTIAEEAMLTPSCGAWMAMLALYLERAGVWSFVLSRTRVVFFFEAIQYRIERLARYLPMEKCEEGVRPSGKPQRKGESLVSGSNSGRPTKSDAKYAGCIPRIGTTPFLN